MKQSLAGFHLAGLFLLQEPRSGARLPARVISHVDLHRLQEAFFRDAGDAPIGQQIELLALRLDRRQPHLQTAFDAGHLDGDLKACAGRRRPGYLQHRILEFQKRRRNATHWVTDSICPIPDTIGMGTVGYGLGNGSISGAFRGATRIAAILPQGTR
jgi:hypothetical protein